MPVPMIDPSRQHAALRPAFGAAFDELVTSGKFILGDAVERLEKELADYCGARAAVGVSSGTDALLVALMALEIGPGDEVITTPFTFFATAGCIARVGATPVFVDIDPVSFNIDPRLIEAAITQRTRAIMPVHLFGQSADMAAIGALAQRHSLKVIEDAAQAIGAHFRGQPVCSLGDIGCLSFYPTKNLAAFGDAGACVTSDPALAKRIAQLRVHGETSRYHHALIGGNFRIDAIQASVLGIKLPHLERWTELRRMHARRYHEQLSERSVNLPLTLPTEAPGMRHVFNQYTIRVAGGRRDALREHLTSRGIACGVYYPVPLHLQECFANLGHQTGAFPESERASAEVLSLPVFPEMTVAEQDEVIAAVSGFFS